MQNHNFHYNFQKFSFAARVVNMWNSLPDHVLSILLKVYSGQKNELAKTILAV